MSSDELKCIERLGMNASLLHLSVFVFLFAKLSESENMKTVMTHILKLLEP